MPIKFFRWAIYLAAACTLGFLIAGCGSDEEGPRTAKSSGCDAQVEFGSYDFCSSTVDTPEGKVRCFSDRIDRGFTLTCWPIETNEG